MSWFIIIVAIVMLYLVNKFFDIKNLLNPFVFFYLYQTVFLFIALSYSDSRFPEIPISPDLKFFIISSYILTFVGALTSQFFFYRLGFNYIRLSEIEINKRPSKSFQISGLIIFLIGIFFFLIFTFKTGGPIVFSDDVENERISRKVGAGLVNLLFIAFMLYGFAVTLFMKDKTKIIKLILFLITGFALASYGSRAPLLKLFIVTFIIVSILSSKKISLKNYLKIGLILFLVLVVFGTLRSNFQNPDVNFLTLLQYRGGWRPFVNIQNLQRIYDFFPSKSDYLYGYSYWVDFKLFFPGSNPNFGTYLKDLMEWEFEGGSVTPSFIGLGYLNFGKIAFFIYPLVYGFLFNSAYQIFIRNKRVKVITLIFLIFLSIGVSGSVSTGLFGTLINNVLFLIIVTTSHLLIKQLIIKNPFKLKFE